jgi:hypothetical protein
VLHHVQRGSFLKQPARKNARPTLVGLLHIDLHKAAGQMLRLPGRCLLTGAQADDDIAKPARFARFHRHIARNAVALIEQPDNRNPLCHGSGTLSKCKVGRVVNSNNARWRGRLIKRCTANGFYRGCINQPRCLPPRNAKPQTSRGEAGARPGQQPFFHSPGVQAS